jgi:hypothetical protein
MSQQSKEPTRREMLERLIVKRLGKSSKGTEDGDCGREA